MVRFHLLRVDLQPCYTLCILNSMLCLFRLSFPSERMTLCYPFLVIKNGLVDALLTHYIAAYDMMQTIYSVLSPLLFSLSSRLRTIVQITLKDSPMTKPISTTKRGLSFICSISRIVLGSRFLPPGVDVIYRLSEQRPGFMFGYLDMD